MTEEEKSQRQREVWERRPKCDKHPGRLATKASGWTKCAQCQPVQKPKVFGAAPIGVGTPVSDSLPISNRSDVMPTYLRDTYELMLNDPNLIALKDDIATAEARIRYLLQQIQESPDESLAMVRALSNIMDRGEAQIRQGKSTYAQLVLEMRNTISEGVRVADLWAEHAKATEQKRKLVESENKRYIQVGWTPEHVTKLITEMCFILQGMGIRQQVFMERLAQSKLFQNRMTRLVPAAEVAELGPEDQLETLKYLKKGEYDG